MRNLILNDSSVLITQLLILYLTGIYRNFLKKPSDLFIKSDLKAIYIKNTIFKIV